MPSVVNAFAGEKWFFKISGSGFCSKRRCDKKCRSNEEANMVGSDRLVLRGLGFGVPADLADSMRMFRSLPIWVVKTPTDCIPDLSITPTMAACCSKTSTLIS